MKALGDGEAEAECRVDEGAAADESVLRVAAVVEAVDRVEVDASAENGRAAGRGLLGHELDGVLNALLGARMGGEEAELVAALAPEDQVLDRALAREAREKGGHGARVVAGPRHVAHPQHVGVRFLAARIAREVGPGAEAGQVAGRLVAGYGAEEADAELSHHRLAVALGRMARGHVADLVADDAGELGLVVGERHEPRGDVDVAARQGEGVDHVAVEHREGEGQARLLRDLRETPADAIDVGAHPLVVVFAAELGDDSGMLPPAELLFLRRRHEGGETLLACRRIDGTAAEGGAEEAGGEGGRDCVAPESGYSARGAHSGSTSICSGWVASIMGPLYDLIQPLTRTRRPA